MVELLNVKENREGVRKGRNNGRKSDIILIFILILILIHNFNPLYNVP